MASASVTMTLSFLVLPDVNPGGDTQSYNTELGRKAAEAVDDVNEAIAEATVALDEQGIALSTTNAGAGDWSGLSLSGAVPDLLSEDNFETLGKMIDKLQKATDILVKVAKIVELVISSFGSLSSIVKTLLGVVQNQVNKWVEDLSSVGLYSIMITPPAFDKALQGNVKFNQFSSGGFQNFVSTLGIAFNNTSDVNRPVFTEEAMVGGFIILIDSDTLDQFFKTMETFSRLFNVIDLIPVNTNFIPPRDVKGSFKYDKKAGKYGIELKWKAPPVWVPMYQVSRSMRAGGREDKQNVSPLKMKLYASRDQWDLFKAVKHKIQTKEWPQEKVVVYDDEEATRMGVPEFNGPVRVASNAMTGGGSYMDYNIKLGADGKPVPLKYYYVVQSGFGGDIGIWGNYSIQVGVPVSPICIDENQAAVIKHQDGSGRNRYRFVRAGMGDLNKWWVFQFKVPFLEDFAKLFSNILESIGGMTDNASSSFSSFIQSIKDKIDYYANMVEALIGIIQAIQSLEFAGRVAYLYLQAKPGGTRGFMSRLRAAQPIEGGFSGPSGITSGLVFLTGIPSTDLTVDEEATGSYEAAVQLKNKTFETLVQLFINLFGGGG